MQLYLPPGLPELAIGQRLRISARLLSARPGRNPGAAARWRWQLARGVVARVAPRASNVVLLAPRQPAGGLATLRRRVRRALSRVKQRRSRAILAALVLGERGELTSEQRARFARAGLSHVLAVSGLHLSLVALGTLALMLALLRRLPPLAARMDPRRPAALVALGLALLYTLLTGAAPATVRACTMAGLLLSAYLVGRAPDLLRPLTLAALLLLAGQPWLLFRAAFQLSFAAVIGIVLMLRHGRVRGWMACLVSGERRGVGWRGARWMLALVFASVGATLATAPLVAKHFGEVPVWGVLANLLAVPLTTFVLLPAAVLGAALGALWPPLGSWLLSVAGGAAGLIDEVAAITAAAPAAALPLRLGWAGALGSLLAVFGLLWDRAGWPRRALIVGGLMLALVVPRVELPSPLRVTFLDVGQGDSTLLRLPSGDAVLVDTGGSERGGYDPGARRVVPALRTLGVRRLALLVISHPHADHVAGAEAVLEQLEVEEVWACWHGQKNRWIERLSRWARRRRVPLSPPRRWARGGVRITPLWPRGEGESCAVVGLGANDNSVVLRVDHGASSLLLVGDIERLAEDALVHAAATPRSSPPGSELRSTLLKVPHHGSATSSTRSFLRAVKPKLAVVSTGHGNRFRLPHQEVLRRYRALGIELLSIARLGSISVVLRRDGALSWRPALSPFD